MCNEQMMNQGTSGEYDNDQVRLAGIGHCETRVGGDAKHGESCAYNDPKDVEKSIALTRG